MRKFINSLLVTMLVSLSTGVLVGCGSEDPVMIRQSEYSVVNGTASEIVVRLKFDDERVTTIAPGDAQIIYSRERIWYEGDAVLEKILEIDPRAPLLNAEMTIDGETVPEAIWRRNHWVQDFEDLSNSTTEIYLDTYALTVTPDLLEEVQPVELPGTEVSFENYPLDINSFDWDNTEFTLRPGDDIGLGLHTLLVIDSEEELRSHVTGDFPPVDFTEKTLILSACRSATEIEKMEIENFREVSPGNYGLWINIFLLDATRPDRRLVAILIDKLPEASVVDFQVANGWEN